MPRLSEYLAPGRTPWSDKYNDSPYANDFDVCIVCGKLTKGNGISVALTGGGDVLVLPEDVEREARDNAHIYMGVWTVGRECGKRIPIEYRLPAHLTHNA